MTDDVALTPGARLAQLAADRPDAPAVVVGLPDGTDRTLSWSELESWSNRLMRLLADRGVDHDSTVAIVLPTCIEHVVATYAALKLGACVMPISHRMPVAERDEMLGLADPAAIAGDPSTVPGGISAVEMTADGWSEAPPDHHPVPDPYKAIGSGGATGRKKLIVSTGGWSYPIGGHPFVQLGDFRDGDVVYSTGPLYHNQAFLFTQLAVFAGASVVLNERFDTTLANRLIAAHRVSVLNTVPTVMMRMLRHDPDGTADLSGLRLLWHMAAMCPEWVKQAWIDRLDGEVRELWAATEMTGITTITGTEWLEHRGSVGRPWNTEVLILDPDGQEMPTGEVGNLWTRFAGGPPLYRYLGADPLPTRPDGFAWVGDLASVDADGYVHLADRRVDLIITGGSNVYPAEVEAVISTDLRVKDVVVVGLANDEYGRLVHAIVEPLDPADSPAEEELRQRCEAALVPYKVPRSFEVVDSLPRDDAGKIRRIALRDERDGVRTGT